MGYRIIIADDEPLIRADLKELLEDLGHTVVAEAADGKEAVARIQKHYPDIVILDIKMPTLDGIDVALQISHSYPVIILTAFTDKSLIDRARKAGVLAYLSKPFREEDISPAIELAVSHFLERTELEKRVTRLKEQLATRKVVDKAKGLLIAREGLSESEAFRKLQKISMNKNKSLRSVAEAFILMYGE